MPNIATVLKAEIARLVRKELRSATEQFRKALTSQRSEVVALKRRVADLEKALKAAGRTAGRRGSPSARESEAADEAPEFRFRAAGMANNRKRLGLSAEDFGLLVGATGQSVYAWEQGRTKPRDKNLAAIAALRGIGKREVAARLDALKSAG